MFGKKKQQTKSNTTYLSVPLFAAAPIRYSLKSQKDAENSGTCYHPVVALAGGGGSAKSGVKNSIVRQDMSICMH